MTIIISISDALKPRHSAVFHAFSLAPYPARFTINAITATKIDKELLLMPMHIDRIRTWPWQNDPVDSKRVRCFRVTAF